jgi:thioredoxin-dependent peroxiredoxin
MITGKAPEFKLTDMNGKSHSLKDFNTKNTVVYFYPKDDTDGCTIEALEFTSTLNELKNLGATVVGISGGDDKSKKAFCEKHKLNVLLLSDPDFSVATKYGVYGEKTMMGKKYMGINRTTFILDKDKKVIKVFEKVEPKGHAQQVIDFVKSH